MVLETRGRYRGHREQFHVTLVPMIYPTDEMNVALALLSVGRYSQIAARSVLRTLPFRVILVCFPHKTPVNIRLNQSSHYRYGRTHRYSRSIHAIPSSDVQFIEIIFFQCRGPRGVSCCAPRPVLRVPR